MADYRLGILGGGQLARMSVIAAQRMGISVVSLDDDPQSPAAQVGPAITGSIHDSDAIARLMTWCDFVTLENEFIRAEVLRTACERAGFPSHQVIPGIETLAIIQDKLLQRQAYEANGVPSPKAVAAEFASDIGFPCVLKARYGGYDGKGTRYVNSESEYKALESLWGSGDWLAEELVSFDEEMAVMVVVGGDGTHDTFPTMITRQKYYVCDLVYPCTDPEVSDLAQKIAVDAVKAVRGTGLYGVELFLEKDGKISVNEMAPRPHNTGHYTLDWGGMSQFEAHVSVVLGNFSKVSPGISACMANVLGIDGAKSFDKALDAIMSEHPDARFHWYGKKEAKAGRKMGHINVAGDRDIIDAAERARSTFYRVWREE